MPDNLSGEVDPEKFDSGSGAAPGSRAERLRSGQLRDRGRGGDEADAEHPPCRLCPGGERRGEDVSQTNDEGATVHHGGASVAMAATSVKPLCRPRLSFWEADPDVYCFSNTVTLFTA